MSLPPPGMRLAGLALHLAAWTLWLGAMRAHLRWLALAHHTRSRVGLGASLLAGALSAVSILA